MRVLAPAKINLSLRVIGKREDGFHEIETFMAPISLADTLEVERQARWIDLTCDDPSLPLGDDNLVVRAARLFLETTKVKGGASIKLEKKIPHGAGLGGGSSDAASTLLALNELFETNLPTEALAEMGEKIGSDVPFFVFGSAALCRGRGELVSPQHLPERFRLLLLKPEFGIPAAAAYARWKDAREIPGLAYAGQEFHGHTFGNDLERPVFQKFVFLAQMKSWLLRQPEVAVAQMSGSGSTIFAILQEKAVADSLVQRAREELDPKLWTCACATVQPKHT